MNARHKKQSNADLFGVEERMNGGSDCSICNGRGYVFDAMGGGRDSGSFVLCECARKICRCNGIAPYEYYDVEKNAMVPCPAASVRSMIDLMHILQRRSQIPARYVWKFINSIDIRQQWADDKEPAGNTDSTNSSLLIAMDHAVETVRQFGNGKKQGLYFHGGTGCGKTLLSCAVLNELIRMYRAPVRYAKINRDILGKLKASFNPMSEIYGEAQKIEEELATIPVLVIDDFGAHRESEWVNSALYDLIDARYERNLLTILTSNVAMEFWRDISGGRVYSRLKHMCSEIRIDAPDYRLTESKTY